LSNKEVITELVERIKNGEPDLMPELWKSVERLVEWKANGIITVLPPSAGVIFDDLHNSGYIALNDAVERYRPESGEFTALFMLCLKTAFAGASGARSKRAMSDPLRQPGTESLNELLPDSDKTTLEDTIPDERDDFEEAEERIYTEQLHGELERALNAIPADEGELLRQRYYHGLTLQEVGARRGVSIERIRQCEGQALRHIRAPKISKGLRQFVEENTPSNLHVGARRFNTTGTSEVELLAMIRESLGEKYAELFEGKEDAANNTIQ